MKKKILYILSLFIFMFSMTGCVKYNATMEIDKDKSMNFSIIYAFDTSVFGDQNVMESDDIQKLTNQGFNVSEYSDGTMRGYTISRHFSNIDSVSSESDIIYSLSGILDEESSKIFKVEKGIFKNTYIANFKFDTSDSNMNGSIDDDSIYDEDDVINFDDDIFNNESFEITDDFDLFGDDNTDFSDSLSKMDLSFNVKLPNSVKSTNATTVLDGGKSLSWVLTSDGASSINFEFELINYFSIFLLCGCVLGLILLIIVLIVIVGKKKNNNNFNINNSSNNGSDNSFIQSGITQIDSNIQSNINSQKYINSSDVVQPQAMQQSQNVQIQDDLLDMNKITPEMEHNVSHQSSVQQNDIIQNNESNIFEASFDQPVSNIQQNESEQNDMTSNS